MEAWKVGEICNIYEAFEQNTTKLRISKAT